MTRVTAGETTVEYDPETGDIAVFAGDTRVVDGRVVATGRGHTEADTGLRTTLDCRPADDGHADERLARCLVLAGQRHQAGAQQQRGC